MKIAQLLLSHLDLNNLKFGGAERVVRNYHKILSSRHESYIIHENNIHDIKKRLIDIKPDVVMCHNDYLTSYLAKKYNLIKFIHISHNPYAEIASGSMMGWIRWHKLRHSPVEVIRDCRLMQMYSSQIRGLIGLNNVLITSLSNRIANKIQKFPVDKPFYYLPNPIDENEFPYHSRVRINRLLFVGKVDLRKRQYLVQEKIKNVDFVGPKRDSVFRYQDTRYLGELSHVDLHELMLKYDGIILTSDGEAMPQVIFEGMLCGMRIFLSKQASWDFESNGKMIIINDNIENLGAKSAETFESVKEFERQAIRDSIVSQFSVNSNSFYNNYLSPAINLVWGKASEYP